MLLGGYAIMLIRGPQQNQLSHPNKTVVATLIFGDKKAESFALPLDPHFISIWPQASPRAQAPSCTYWSICSLQRGTLKGHICQRKRQQCCHLSRHFAATSPSLKKIVLK